jgi:hypothetical protein
MDQLRWTKLYSENLRITCCSEPCFREEPKAGQPLVAKVGVYNGACEQRRKVEFESVLNRHTHTHRKGSNKSIGDAQGSVAKNTTEILSAKNDLQLWFRFEAAPCPRLLFLYNYNTRAQAFKNLDGEAAVALDKGPLSAETRVVEPASHRTGVVAIPGEKRLAHKYGTGRACGPQDWDREGMWPKRLEQEGPVAHRSNNRRPPFGEKFEKEQDKFIEKEHEFNPNYETD